MPSGKRPDPMLSQLETPLHAVLNPLGFPMRIESNDERVIECARSSFGIFAAGAEAAPPLRLRLIRDPAGRSHPPWPAPSYRYWNDMFSVVCGPDNFITVDMHECRAMGYFSAAMLDDREFFRWTFLDCAVYMLLQRHHLTAIHAACVVKGGGGICLSGPSGAGKSSLTYACLRAGYALLADDAVYIARLPEGARLRGNPSRLHFPVEARRLFPEFNDVPVGIRRDGEEFLAIEPGRFSGRVATDAQPGALIFLDRRPGARVRLAHVEPAEAFSLLFDELPFLGSEEEMETHRRAIEQFTAAGAYRLTYDGLNEAVAAIGRMAPPQRHSTT